jgi:DNA-binding transcriptional regulator YhcF (GntR family)
MRRTVARAKLGVDEVYAILRDRIASGAFSTGTKLPSCRALAIEFHSNPNSVNRALQRLESAGIVRTVTRRGSFVTGADLSVDDGTGSIQGEVIRVVHLARASGVSLDRIETLFRDAIHELGADIRVTFVECNQTDLDEMATTIGNATGIEVERQLISELGPRRRGSPRQALATPLFHFRDVAAIVGERDVIDLNFVPSAATLRTLAHLDDRLRVAVLSPTERGVARVSSIARQYFSGAVEGLTGTWEDIGASQLDQFGVVVYTNASGAPRPELLQSFEAIKIKWVLDPGSAEEFRRRVQNLSQLAPASASQSG